MCWPTALVPTRCASSRTWMWIPRRARPRSRKFEKSVRDNFKIPDNREKYREFFLAHSEKPHGLRVFAILMPQNRELTGNLTKTPVTFGVEKALALFFDTNDSIIRELTGI